MNVKLNVKVNWLGKAWESLTICALMVRCMVCYTLWYNPDALEYLSCVLINKVLNKCKNNVFLLRELISSLELLLIDRNQFSEWLSRLRKWGCGCQSKVLVFSSLNSLHYEKEVRKLLRLSHYVSPIKCNMQCF